MRLLTIADSQTDWLMIAIATIHSLTQPVWTLEMEEKEIQKNEVKTQRPAAAYGIELEGSLSIADEAAERSMYPPAVHLRFRDNTTLSVQSLFTSATTDPPVPHSRH